MTSDLRRPESSTKPPPGGRRGILKVFGLDVAVVCLLAIVTTVFVVLLPEDEAARWIGGMSLLGTWCVALIGLRAARASEQAVQRQSLGESERDDRDRRRDEMMVEVVRTLGDSLSAEVKDRWDAYVAGDLEEAVAGAVVRIESMTSQLAQRIPANVPGAGPGNDVADKTIRSWASALISGRLWPDARVSLFIDSSNYNDATILPIVKEAWTISSRFTSRQVFWDDENSELMNRFSWVGGPGSLARLEHLAQHLLELLDLKEKGGFPLEGVILKRELRSEQIEFLDGISVDAESGDWVAPNGARYPGLWRVTDGGN